MKIIFTSEKVLLVGDYLIAASTSKRTLLISHNAIKSTDRKSVV